MSLENKTRREFLKGLAIASGLPFLNLSLDSGRTLDKGIKKLTKKIETLNWISYAPSNFNPWKNDFPPEESISKDLKLLHKFGFNGVITYASDGTLYLVPKVAKEVGFKGAIMGLWNVDTFNKNEITRKERENAISQREYVDAYIVGNEGLWNGYEVWDIKLAIDSLRRKTKRPVSTTEPVGTYLKATRRIELIELGDFIAPNTHPYWSDVTDPKKAAEWTRQQYSELMTTLKGFNLEDKPVIFKEVGLPSDGDSRCSEKKQKEYYDYLLKYKQKINFSVFEAFDQYWKEMAWTNVEPHWGIFDKDRKPKKVARFFKKAL